MLHCIVNSLWMQKDAIQDQIQHQASKQEIHLAQQAERSVSLGEKNTIHIVVTIKKRNNCIWKIMVERSFLSEAQFDILQVLMKTFHRSLRKDAGTLARLAIPLTRDITNMENEWLTRETTEEEIQRVVNQSALSKLLYQMICVQFFIENTDTYWFEYLFYDNRFSKT